MDPSAPKVNSAAVGQLAVVIEHVIMPAEGDVAAVDGEAVFRFVHDPAAVGPGSMDGLRRRIGHVLRHAAGGIRQVIGIAPLREPGTFLIAHHHLFLAAVGPVGFHGLGTETGGIMEAGNFLPAVREGDHVVSQAAVPATLVAPEQPGRAVIVDEDGRVDEREPGRERPADGVGVRPFGPVRDRHGEGVAPGRRLGQAHVPVPFPVSLHGLRSPGTVALEGPRERGRGHGRTEVGPVHHVFRAV